MSVRQPTDRRILVVGCDAATSEAIRAALATVGCDIRFIQDTLTTQQQADDWQPDLIFLDVDRPGVDSWAVIRSLRDSLDQIPLILLTDGPLGTDEVATLGAD